jgi:hypothetical protein
MQRPQPGRRHGFLEEILMTKNAPHPSEELDELEYSDGPDYDLELFDETPIDEMLKAAFGESARRRVERRAETAWLRKQLVDWDDWDEYFEAH